MTFWRCRDSFNVLRLSFAVLGDFCLKRFCLNHDSQDLGIALIEKENHVNP
jgi:hypothetical protein